MWSFSTFWFSPHRVFACATKCRPCFSLVAYPFYTRKARNSLVLSFGELFAPEVGGDCGDWGDGNGERRTSVVWCDVGCRCTAACAAFPRLSRLSPCCCQLAAIPCQLANPRLARLSACFSHLVAMGIQDLLTTARPNCSVAEKTRMLRAFDSVGS